MDISPYYGILFALAAAIFTALLSWKLSGEVFSETKFLRLVLASFALALGFNISGTPLANVAVNPFASALAGLLFSKGLNYIKEVPTQLLSQIEGIVTEASKQIPSTDQSPASATLPASSQSASPSA
jgi:hypothetical protein